MTFHQGYPLADFRKHILVLMNLERPEGTVTAATALPANFEHAFNKFVAAGLGLLGLPGVSEIWSGLATAGAITSLLLLLNFCHRWLILGVLIDLGLILALVAAVVVPSLGGGAAVEIKSAARSLAAGLRQTRNRALNANRSAILALDVAKREFRLPGERRAHKLPARVDIVLFTARSEQLSEKGGAIRFFPDGSSTGGRITLSIDSIGPASRSA